MRKILSLLLFLATLPTLAAASELEAQRRALAEQLERLTSNPEGLPAKARLAAFIDGYFEYAMLEHPELATYIGLPTGHDRWTDQSLEAIERRKRDTGRAIEGLRSIPRAELQGEDRLNYDLILDSLTLSVAGQRFPEEYLAISQLSGVQQDAARMFSMMPTTTVRQYENILARLRGVPERVDQTLVLLAQGLAAGITPPQVTLRDVPQQVLNVIPEEPLTSPLLNPFTRFPATIPAPEQERLRSEAVRVYSENVAPAYRRLHAFLVETYLPGARESIAMKELPEGESWYALRARQATSTELSPREIHQIGLAEVARIRGEMDRVIAESGFDGDFSAFTELLRTDPRFYFDDPEELLRTYRDIAKRADAELPKLFGLLPRLPYGVQAVPAHAERSQTTAYYTPGSLEAGRSAIFFANTYALDTRPKWEMEALTLHEAVPGHHLQIAIAQEQQDLPWFRRFGGYTAYIEGWGLYAESLGEEMGFYQDPYSKFGQLTYEIWRAIRLVVDTGMHALGWSREQAIEYFTANSGKSGHDIVVEIDRYIVWPGQALAYKLGELKIKELRAHAAAQLGDAFDLRAFHDTVLGAGALPLSVLDTRVREWVAAEKAALGGAAIVQPGPSPGPG
jgi:uncharacterized protein (DUF885 family)